MKELRKMNVIGPEVRKIRLRRGWTQPQLVAKCQIFGWDISRESIAKIESQIRTVTDIEMLKIADVLEVHFSAIVNKSNL